MPDVYFCISSVVHNNITLRYMIYLEQNERYVSHNILFNVI